MNLFSAFISLKVICLFIYVCLLGLVELKPRHGNENDIVLASAHVTRVLKMMCQVPQPRAVRLETDELRVVPQFTILHRCGNSGCCDAHMHHCVAKKHERVTVYAFVHQRDARGVMVETVEQFVKINHTECHCESILDTLLDESSEDFE